MRVVSISPRLCLSLLPAIWALGCGVDQGVIEAGPGAADPFEDTADPGGIDWETPEDGAPCALIDGALPDAPEGAFIDREATIWTTRPRCAAGLHAGAGAAGSTLSLSLVERSGDAAEIGIYALSGEPLAGPAALSPGESLTFAPALGGEFLVRVSPADPDAPDDDYALSLGCVDGCDLEYTRYPLVFLHGAGGADAYLDLLDYWVGVEDDLSGAGFHVQIHAVSAMDTVAARADGWLAILDDLEADGLGRRFNLIGHSQGGLDARYLAGVLEDRDRVASVVTISSPHRGAPAADLYAGLIELSIWEGAILDGVAEALVGVIGLEGEALTAQVQDMTTESMSAFNDAVPDADGVYYASWAGRSCGVLDWSCQSEMDGEIISPLFAIPFAWTALVAGDNDGLVPCESAEWGEFMGHLPADHLAEVGYVSDLYPSAFDHGAFYLDEARRLAALGL